jgi:hypothetical protein
VPQLAASVCVSTHAVPHAVWLPGHLHAPLVQASPVNGHAAHAPPPLPHREADWLANGSQVLPLQQPLHPVFGPQTHFPAEHVVPAAQTVPHVPQLAPSLERSAQIEPQGVKLELHA